MSTAQHIEWLNLIEKTGPFLTVGVLEEAFPQGLDKVETRQRQRVRSAYDEWRDTVDTADPQLDAIHQEWVRLVLQDLLEYDPSVLKPQTALPDTLAFREPLTGISVRPDYAVLSGDTPRLLVARYAPDTDLSAPVANDGWSASPIERMNQLCRSLGVRLGLVTDGEQWAVVSVPTDGGSSIGTWFARIWQQEPVTLQAFVSLLGVRRCFGKTEDTFDGLLQRSQGHQNEITDTLGQQVRRAVEVLVQSLDQADVAHNRELLVGVTPGQLYEAGLTVMMRLVILLCAEQRKLLLLGEETYDQSYSVTTLRARLVKEQSDLTDEVLERRHDAWSRLLAVCRAVYGGVEHDTLRLPPLGGSLFDPDRFPFLEGRAADTSWRDTPANPLPIDNRTVLMLLTALQILEQGAGAQMLSYEALDVEQIGHVYEGLLERTVKRVSEVTLGLMGSAKSINPVATLRELDEHAAAGSERFVSFLEERTGRSIAALSKALETPVDDALTHRVAVACGSTQTLAPRLRPFAHLLREDNWKRLLLYQKDTFIVTMGAGRRETGTHYTPKSLTEPIVQHTLEPLVYSGPAEGRRREEWRLKSPAEIFALKVCDMAMGSGAFLVQTCRWLAERIVEAWDLEEKAGHTISIEGAVLTQAGDNEALPRDKAERVVIARRLIVSRCLYGVDINPMAVELAKLSLWLVTMMKGRPFSFLDHALKCGDSLLGISELKQLERFSMRDTEHDHPLFDTTDLARHVKQAADLRRELEAMPSHTSTQIAEKTRLDTEADTLVARLRAAADFLVAVELNCPTSHGWNTRRAIAAGQMQAAWKAEIVEFVRLAHNELDGRRPFHWPIEFPEVFDVGTVNDRPAGFDAFIGNPPFMHGSWISSTFGDLYADYLRRVTPNAVGKIDFSVYFLRRTASLTAKRKSLGLVITSKIKEGAARLAGYDSLIRSGWSIYFAISDLPWPGTAGVIVSCVGMRNGDWVGERQLNGAVVSNIDSRLEANDVELSITPLDENRGTLYLGAKPDSLGFTLTPIEAKRIFAVQPQSRDVVRPYFSGTDLNDDPNLQPPRFIIDFSGMSLDQAAAYPELLKILEREVRPSRMKLKRDSYRERWWQFTEPQIALFQSIRRFPEVLALCRVSKHFAVRFVPTAAVYSDSTVVFTRRSMAEFAVLSSSLHNAWAVQFSGTHGSGTPEYKSYKPATCGVSFPFPGLTQALERVGREYQDNRQRLMLERREGLTDIYNRFHDPGERSEDIGRLRALHVEMDAAVAAAYDWSDFDLGHSFHETKQGVRFTISTTVRRIVLNRLIALNHQRHADEIDAGVHNKKKGGSRRGKSDSETSELDLQ